LALNNVFQKKEGTYAGLPFSKHISDYPSDRTTGWAGNLQGVTHDKDNWFIPQHNRIWKIPVKVDSSSTMNEADPDRGISTG
jgi:hypothetical protein